MADTLSRIWQGIEVQCFDDCYFDATTIGASFGKRACEYLRLERTKEYLEELSRELKIPSGIGIEKGPYMIVMTQRGGFDKGTRFHPRLMIDYGRWLSVKFSVWLDAWILELLTDSKRAVFGAEHTPEVILTPSPQLTPSEESVRPARLWRKQLCVLNETDLHCSIVKTIRERWPNTLFTAGLGELQNTSNLRIEANNKGYCKGLPDLLIFEQTADYGGFAIELKHPGFEAEARSEQLEVLFGMRQRGWKTLVSSDFTEILLELSEYLRMSLHRCECCKQLFASDLLLKQHHARKKRRRHDIAVGDA